jgi:hypothetical protein
VLIRTHAAFVGLCIASCLLFVSVEARAYPSMLRHGYTGCATCHLDPAGSGVLTAYGRALGELELRSRYDEDPSNPGPGAEFLFGLVPLPDELMLGGDGRFIWMADKAEGAAIEYRSFFMQADLEAGLRIGPFLASGSIGYAETGGLGAAITRKPDHNVVSRQHWLGVEIVPEWGLIARAGRMNLPFGIRNVEHTLWARTLSETTINDDQQYGLAADIDVGPVRGELMAIFGNLQLRPDDYRERGVAGFVEWFPNDTLALGLSELSTHRELDPTYLRETWRHQAGAFGRWSTPYKPLLVLAEANYLFDSPKQDERRQGAVGYLQLDYEPVQGFHLLGTGEMHNVGIDGAPVSWGLWLSEHWFFAPHADVRVDGIYQSLGSNEGRTEVITVLVQGHVYL